MAQNMASGPGASSFAGVRAVLSVFLVAAAATTAAAGSTPSPTAAPSSSKSYTVEEACKQAASGLHDLCVATLSSSKAATASSPSGTAALAQAAIQAAQRNASETATYLSSIYDDDSLENKTAQLQQCLEDCGERYESAVEQLSDAASAVGSGAYSESEALVAAGQAEVKLCQRGCQAVQEHRNILTARNREVDQLCSIAIAITKLIRGPPE
ncbi:unnamed protein product [Urochloa decumbens]|uniref:Pectinesterase inhibitor domain-containing protein n=1 Tax=Urochloa decumbens TaxID=240449 RepID=A0ABC8ZB41_9POAL